MGKITEPSILTTTHITTSSDCGNGTLNEWLIRRALKNQSQGASRTFVICENGEVVGFYALASGSVERLTAPKSMARNMPNPIPVIVLGRLAVDIRYQGQSLGAALLKDAILRSLSVAQNIGVRGLLVHAISDEAKRFYSAFGFQESLIDPMTMVLSIQQLSGHL